MILYSLYASACYRSRAINSVKKPAKPAQISIEIDYLPQGPPIDFSYPDYLPIAVTINVAPLHAC